MESLRGVLASLVLTVSAALVVVAIAILPFLGPVWVGFEQGRVGSAALTGFTPEQVTAVTGSILADLVIGPPDFDVTLNGVPVLTEDERSHMRDVRGVFAAFYMVAIGGAVVLAASFALAFAQGRGPRARLWHRLARAGGIIAVVTVVGGTLGVFFFDAAFLAFHELFFPGGNFLFPTTDHLVQLFPDQFWMETTVGVGIVIVLLGVLLSWFGNRRARALERVGA